MNKLFLYTGFIFIGLILFTETVSATTEAHFRKSEKNLPFLPTIS